MHVEQQVHRGCSHALRGDTFPLGHQCLCPVFACEQGYWQGSHVRLLIRLCWEPTGCFFFLLECVCLGWCVFSRYLNQFFSSWYYSKQNYFLKFVGLVYLNCFTTEKFVLHVLWQGGKGVS